MKDTKHTPGPWSVGYASPEKAETSTLAVWTTSALEAGSGHVICKVSPELTQDETDIANAHLLAAAPELLEVCQKLLSDLKYALNSQGAILGLGAERIKQLLSEHTLIAAAESAIAKATPQP